MKKWVEVTFDNIESYVIPFEWYEALVRDKCYFEVLGIQDVEDEKSIC